MAENALTRRRFMAASAAALSGLALFGCSNKAERQESGTDASENEEGKILVACFSATELKGLASDADWVGAHRFAAGAPESEIVDWADSLNLR